MATLQVYYESDIILPIQTGSDMYSKNCITIYSIHYNSLHIRKSIPHKTQLQRQLKTKLKSQWYSNWCCSTVLAIPCPLLLMKTKTKTQCLGSPLPWASASTRQSFHGLLPSFFCFCIFSNPFYYAFTKV